MSDLPTPVWDVALWDRANVCMRFHPALGDAMTVYQLRFQIGAHFNWASVQRTHFEEADVRLRKEIEHLTTKKV